MKSKLKLLSLALTSLLLPNVIFADQNMPTVTVYGSVTLTCSPTSSACMADLSKYAGCSSCDGCSVKNGTILQFPSKGCTSISFALHGGSSCKNSQAEFTLGTKANTYDISLVNGWSGPVSITGGKTIIANSKKANGTNQKNGQQFLAQGVYPYGCSNCNNRKGGPGCNLHEYKGSNYTGCSTDKNSCNITDSAKSYVVTFMQDE